MGEKKPVVYRVGWFSVDEHGERDLAHGREFSKGEFVRLVNSALTEVFERAVKEEEPVFMDDAISEVVKILEEKHGFSEPEFRGISYEWPLEKSIEHAVDPRLRAAIPPELLEKVLELNERAWRRLFSRKCGGGDAGGQQRRGEDRA